MFLRSPWRLNPSGQIGEVSVPNCGFIAARWRSVSGVESSEHEPDVDAHLRALDDEIARLRQLEEAMDRRLEEAEEERRVIEREIEGDKGGA